MIIHAALLKIILDDMVESELISTADLEALAAVDAKDKIIDMLSCAENIEKAICTQQIQQSDFRTSNNWRQYNQ